MTKYTHAVVRRIVVEENGKRKETDELTYALDINHAYGIANQLMAAGRTNLTIIELKVPTTIEDAQ